MLRLEVQGDPATVWIDRYNALMDRAFRVSKPVATAISRRMADGASLDDLLLVLEWAVVTWRGTQREQWIVPSTLLRPMKFQERLDLAREWGQKREETRARRAAAEARRPPPYEAPPVVAVPREELATFGMEMARKLNGGG